MNAGSNLLAFWVAEVALAVDDAVEGLQELQVDLHAAGCALHVETLEVQVVMSSVFRYLVAQQLACPPCRHHHRLLTVVHLHHRVVFGWV